MSKTDVTLFVISSNMKLIPKVKLAILHVSSLSVCLCVSGVIERWELLQAQCRGEQHTSSQRQQELTSDLDDITSWLEIVTPALDNQQKLEPVVSVEGMTAKAKELRVSVGAGRGTRDERRRLCSHSLMVPLSLSLSQEMHKMFACYKSIMLSINLRAQGAPQLADRLGLMNRLWSRSCTSLQQWDTNLRETLMRCQVRAGSVHWGRRGAVRVSRLLHVNSLCAPLHEVTW